MRLLLMVLIVFLGGFAIMVLEIIGARFLAKDFGGSFYVWVSQIGIILTALAVGYAMGGILADRARRTLILGSLLVMTGLATWFIPNFSQPLIDAIILRHDRDQPIPVLWQKLDPMIGGALIFFLPCCVLAMLSPYTVRLAARKLAHVGRVSGLIYTASTIGSIAGVFVAGYILIDHFTLSQIFRAVGALTVTLGLVMAFLSRWLGSESHSATPL